MSKVLLILNGVEHFLDAIMAGASQAPRIEVSLSEINLDDTQPEHQVTFSVTDPASIEIINNGQLTFYKQHGKYTILTGKNKLSQTEKTGKNKLSQTEKMTGILISSPALKKTRVPDPNAQAYVEPEQPRKTYDPSFANRPRFDTSKADKRAYGEHNPFVRHETPRPRFNENGYRKKETI